MLWTTISQRKLPSRRDRCKLDVQRTLDPKAHELESIHPVPAFVRQLHVEVEDQLGEDDSQFRICQVLAEAAVHIDISTTTRIRRGSSVSNLLSWSKAERLESSPVVVLVALCSEPAIWNEEVWVFEVALGAIGCVVCHRDAGLS